MGFRDCYRLEHNSGDYPKSGVIVSIQPHVFGVKEVEVKKLWMLIWILIRKDNKIMAAIDDLNAAVAAQQAENTLIISTLGTVATQLTTLQGQVTAFQAQVTALQAQLAAAGTVNDPAVEAAAQAIQAGLTSVQTAIAPLLPPAPPVGP